MERLARVEVLHDRLRQVGPHHPREPHLREGRELLGHARVRVLGFIFELQRRPDALDSYRGARPRRGGPWAAACSSFHKIFVDESYRVTRAVVASAYASGRGGVLV